MNKKIILKNKSFTKMFSFLVVLVMVAFCSSSVLAETIHVRLNLSVTNKTYDGLQSGNLSWKNSMAKLIKVSDGTEVSISLCDVNLNPASVNCTFDTKDAGTGKYCYVTSSGMLTLMNATLSDLDPNNDYVLDAVTTYPNNGVADLYYSTDRLVSNKGVINHKYLTIKYSTPITVEKVYDGTTFFSVDDYSSSLMNVNAYTIDSLVGSETCQIVDIAYIYTPSKDVGNYDSAIVSGIRIEGTGNVANNYKVNSFNVNAIISQKNISVKDNAIAIKDKTYNGNNTTATIDWANTTHVVSDLFNGVIAGDSIDLVRGLIAVSRGEAITMHHAIANFLDVNVGNSKDVNIENLSLETTGDYRNYTLIPDTAISHGNIVPANLDTAHISMTATLTYGQSLSEINNPGYTQDDTSIQYKIDHWIYNGIDSNSYQPRVYETGIQAEVYRLISNSSVIDSNYNPGIITVNLTVNPKPIYVKENAIAIKDKTYNGNNTATIDWANTTHVVTDLFNGVIAGDSVDLLRTGLDAVSRGEAGYMPHATATFSDSAVADLKSVTITGLSLAAGGDNQNYTLIPDTAISLGNIVPANLPSGLTIISDTVVYGAILGEFKFTANPAPVGYIYQYTYLHNGIEDASYKPLVSETTTQVIVTKLLGTTIGSGIDPNYYTDTLNVNITVVPDTIAVTGIGAYDTIYNGTVAAKVDTTNVLYNGLNTLPVINRNGVDDDLAISFSNVTATFNNANAGTGKIVNLTTPVASGISLPNYYITYNTTATANIRKAPYLTMKLKDAKVFDTIDYPTNFDTTLVAEDFDFNGFINSVDSVALVANFDINEDFRFALTNTVAPFAYVSKVSPVPGTYNVVVNNPTGIDSLRNGLSISLTVPAAISNYDSIVFLASSRQQVVNATPVVVVFPTVKSKSVYGWTLAEIYNSTNNVGGYQLVTTTSSLTPTDSISAYTLDNNNNSIQLKGMFKWISPSIIPNINDTVDYIFIPDASYNGAYGDTVFASKTLDLEKAYLAITLPPSTSLINVGQRVGDAIISQNTGVVVHKTKPTTIVFNSTLSTGTWAYSALVDTNEIINVKGKYSRNVEFTLTDESYLKNYYSPVSMDTVNALANLEITVNPATKNVNPSGVRFDVTYGTKISDIETNTSGVDSSFTKLGKESATNPLGTFNFVDALGNDIDNDLILYRNYADTTLYVIYTPADTNYEADTFLVNVKVNPKTLQYTSHSSKIYDGITNVVANVSNDYLVSGQIITHGSISDSINFDSLSYNLLSKNVGTYTLADIDTLTIAKRLVGPDSYNYELANKPSSANDTITKRDLYVDVISDSISIREAIPTFTMSWRGLQNGETEADAIVDHGQQIYVDFSNLTLSPMTRVSGQDPVTVGSSWIHIPSGKYTALDSNYNIILPSYSGIPSGDSNVLTVSPAEIKIIAQNRQRVYGEITNPYYFIDQYPYNPNRLYYDFDVYEYRSATDSILIDEAEKESMFLQTPSIACDSNTLNRQVGKYVIGIATNTQLRPDIYNNNVYQIIEHVDGILTINKATPRVLTLPTTSVVNYGGKLSDIALTGGSVTAPYVGSDLSTNGHFEWDTTANLITPTVGTFAYPVKYVVDDSRNYNNAIINNQYYDSINYFNWSPIDLDSLHGAAFTSVININKVKPVVIWPTSTILNYGQRLSQSAITDGSTYNPVDPTRKFEWLTNIDTIPSAGMNMFAILYSSANSNYDSLVSTIPVYTNKTTPKLVDTAYVANYSFGQTLNANNNFTASFYNTYNNVTVDGTLNWVNGTLTPVNGNSYAARFTPNDQVNYNDKIISVKVVVDQTTPIVSWPSTSNLTYGQKLSDVNLMGGSAVNPNNNTISVAGNFVWETPDSIPNVSNSSYTLRFIPKDSVTMLETTTNVTVNVLKATPVIKIATNVANDVYGKTLSQRGLPTVTASNVVNHRTGEINENAISGGTISWVSSNVRPTVNQEIYLVNYTPVDSANYNSVNNIPVSVITTKATPTVTLAALNAYSYGQTLSTKTLQIATEQNTSLTPVLTITPSGRVAWNEPNTIPVNGSTHQVNYTPNDVDNYNDTILNVTVTVNTSVPSITLPVANNLVYGQKLEDADLTNGVARNVYTNESIAGTFTFATPSLVPSASSVGVSQTVVFTPSDLTKYSPVNNLSVNVFTAKATPVVTVNSLASQVYGKTLLQRSSNPAHTAKNIVSHRLNTEELTITTDTIIWSIPATVPTVAQETYTATYSVTGANAANYNTVQVEVVVPTTKATPTVTLAALNAYNYGQTLSTQTLQIATEQNTSLTPALTITPSGRVTWNEPNTIPVNVSTHQVNYTPNDVDNYNNVILDVTVNVNPSTPVVTFPIASNLTYGQLLADADLTNGSARNQYSNESVAGTFSFVTPTTLTSASVNNGISANQVIFTPSDLTKHTTLSGTVDVFTAKATPVVTPNVVATDSYGKTLSQRLPSATAKNVISHRTNLVEQSLTGSILWNTPTTIPTVAEENFTATYSVTGADSSNYNKVQVEVMVPTTKATPVVNGAAVAAYTYGEALTAKDITVTNVVNPNDASLVLTGGTIAWNSIDVLPTTGVTSHAATFTPSSIDVANYNPVVFNVNVTVNKANPAVVWPTTTAITYGQTLAEVALTGSHYAVNTINNADVPGTFVWVSETTVIPSNSNTAYRLRFIPNDLVNYYTDSTMINLIINKAVPTVNWGTFSTITYGESLSDITVTDETAVNPITGLAITGGTFAWINPAIQPNVNNSGFVRTYTPSDAANYKSVQSGLLTVVVNKANPVIAQTSSPYVITYGQVLPAITATATNAINSASVNGNYEWNYTDEHLPQAGAVTTYQVRFTPIGTDAENYNIVDNAFNVQVNKAKPVVIIPTASSLVYEQTLAESLLTGGSAMNSYSNDAVAGTFTWELPTTIPNAGSNAYPVVFVPQDQNNYVNSDPIDVVVEVAKKHIDILISNLEHIYDGNQKEATFSDAEGRVDLTGMIDAKYYQGNTNVLISDQAPISVGSYRVIATILPTENYEGCDTAVLIINKDASKMSNPEDEVEIVNAIIPGMNQYFKIRDYEQMKPITVRMINANGNQVYQSDNYTNNFDMSNLPKGTYFYTVTFTLNGSEYTKTGRVEVVRK